MFVSVDDLLSASKVAALIAPNRFGKVYQNVLFRAVGSVQQIVCTDLTTSMVVEVPIKGEPIDVSVPAKFFSSLLAIYKEPLEITVEHEPFLDMVVSLATSSEGAPAIIRQLSHLKGIDPADYPSVNLSDEGFAPFSMVRGADLAEYATRLKTTMAKDDEFVTFTGEVMQSYNKYSLTYLDVDLDRPVLRIPINAFQLVNLLAADDDKIEILHTKDKVLFVGPGYMLETELGSGGFADVTRYKTGTNSLVTIDADDLRHVLKATTNVAGYLDFTAQADGLTVTLRRQDDPSDVLFSATLPHTTPNLAAPFSVTVTASVIRPIVNGLGKGHVAFGLRNSPEAGHPVGIIVSDGYVQLFAQALRPTMK